MFMRARPKTFYSQSQQRSCVARGAGSGIHEVVQRQLSSKPNRQSSGSNMADTMEGDLVTNCDIIS